MPVTPSVTVTLWLPKLCVDVFGVVAVVAGVAGFSRLSVITTRGFDGAVVGAGVSCALVTPYENNTTPTNSKRLESRLIVIVYPLI